VFLLSALQVKAVHKDLGDEAHGFADLWSFCGAPDTERWTWEPWKTRTWNEWNGEGAGYPLVICYIAIENGDL
jgi:hypothetical protein